MLLLISLPRSLVAMSAPTNKSTIPREITTPMKSNENQIPKTPSLIPHDDFNLTPNTQTTHSFADSGFFSAADGTYGAATGYKDWILFPDVEDGFAENEFLDTSKFFQDADETMNYPDMENHEAPASMHPSPSSLELPPLDKAFNPIYERELRTLTQSLESHYISSPPQPPYQPPQGTDFTTTRRIGDENTSMLEIWQRSQERSERIAYEFEQPPYAQREHLLPVFRQSSRVRRRSGNGSARRNRRAVGL